VSRTDGRTDRQTDRITISISRVSSSMLTRDKNQKALIEFEPTPTTGYAT